MNKVKVVLVEDEKKLRESMVEILEIFNYDVHSCEDGESGVRTILEQKPDVVICDIKMPRLTGYDVLSRIRNEKELVLTPFIFISAKAEVSDVRAGMNLGADDYITKPFKHLDLLKAIESRLNRRKDFDLLENSSSVKLNKEILKQLSVLSRQELNVIKQICEKKSSKEISEQMFISPKTIENHRFNIVSKLKLKGPFSLMKFCMENKAEILNVTYPDLRKLRLSKQLL
jgi:FixJ family two-component response regulator